MPSPRYTSDTRDRRRSQPRSLLAMAWLNNREIPGAPHVLKAGANGPDVLGLRGGLGPKTRLAVVSFTAGRPSVSEANTSVTFKSRVLFVQGTREALEELNQLLPTAERLGERATLHLLESADHFFHVPARSGRTDADLLAESPARRAAPRCYRVRPCVPSNRSGPGQNYPELVAGDG